MTQYKDLLEDGRMFWEGEMSRANDHRILNAANEGDRIVLFYRKRYHMPFSTAVRLRSSSTSRWRMQAGQAHFVFECVH